MHYEQSFGSTPSGSAMHPRPPIPQASSSTTKGRVADYDKELGQPTAAEGPGWKPSLDLRGMFSTSASLENETKRAMQSRHLMMIGEFL